MISKEYNTFYYNNISKLEGKWLIAVYIKKFIDEKIERDIYIYMYIFNLVF